jgi:glycosyltransferase involved in cell wall biosynthesis
LQSGSRPSGIGFSVPSVEPSASGPSPIVHVVLALNVGGLERMLLRLLAHTDRARFSPSVYALDEPGTLAPELARIGVPITVVRRGAGIDAGLPLRLAAHLRRAGARIVHTHNASPHLYGGVAAALARARGGSRFPRVVHTKHGRNDPDVARKVLLNRIAAHLSDRVVAVCDDTAALARDLERVDPRRVLTIPNGVDTREFQPGGDRLGARAALGVPPGGFHVGCVARLAAVKDHRTLLAAFERVRRVVPDAHLTLIGDGPEQAALEAETLALGLAGAVTFAGARASVSPLLPAFDVFALASRSEGGSLTLLEAAAAGLPIVTTRVGGNPEIVVDGATGLLVPAGDPASLAEALLALALRADRASLGAAGRARVERLFSVERMAQSYQDLYAEVLGSPCANGQAQKG